MPRISDIVTEKPEGTKKYPIYRADTLEMGKIFAEASMGFLADVSYGSKGSDLTVKVSTDRPVLATLGCQLAGWTVEDTMMSGPLRVKAKKPGFIFDKLNLGVVPPLPDVVCVEGDTKGSNVMAELKKNDIPSAEILWTTENSKAQFINVPARAIEIALFRLFFMDDIDINNFKITKAMSTVETSLDKEDLSCELNDSIRYNGSVTLMGDFKGFRDFEPIVTKHAGLEGQRFKTVMDECGSVAKCPLELFSVSQLTIIDKGKTRVF